MNVSAAAADGLWSGDVPWSGRAVSWSGRVDGTTQVRVGAASAGPLSGAGSVSA